MWFAGGTTNPRPHTQSTEVRSHSIRITFAPDTAAAVVVDAYRHWLGYEVQQRNTHGEGASRAVSGEKLQRRIATLENDVDVALTILEGLNLDELETWLGDDDPGGYNEQYWPDSMYVYKEKLNLLGDLATDIGQLVDAGVFGDSRRLIDNSIEPTNGSAWWKRSPVNMGVNACL